jgi:hypothetical protein
MRRLAIVTGLALALSACGGNGSGADDANALGADNMAIDMNAGLDANAMDALPGLDANGAVDANSANLMEQDATTHDPDTNLANGI